MKLPITSWKKTLASLGYKVVLAPQRISQRISQRHSSRRTSQRTERQAPNRWYERLEPRQLLVADPLIHVVDRGSDLSFQYTVDGNSIDAFSLQSTERARGAATSPDGKTLFVLDANRSVHIFDALSQEHLGTWLTEGLVNPEGIATDGTDVWIVDRSKDRVYRFANMANQRDGLFAATDSFRLSIFNRKPTGITSDGDNIWVADDRDRIYVYNMDGRIRGSWRLDFRNGKPTGLAIDPSGGDGLWVVDGKDDRVYFYASGKKHRWGYRWASDWFRLENENHKAEGIAINPFADIPATPSITSISNDTGIDPADAVTNDNTLIFSGISDPFDTVTITEPSLGELGSDVANEFGNWSIDVTSNPLPDGIYAIKATASDGDHASRPSTPLEIEVDTTPTSNLALLSISQDTGIDESDRVTSDNTLAITGITEPFVQVRLFESMLGELANSISDGNGNFSFDLTSTAIPDGRYVFQATATDRAGNTSNPSAPLSVNVDTQVPLRPNIVGISFDTGRDSTDGITSSSTQTIRGTAEPRSRVTVRDEDYEIVGSTIANANGQWSVNASLPEAVYELVATATDPAGNESTDSDTMHVVIDQTNPDIPSFIRINTDSGDAEDKVTNDNSLVISGSAEPGTFVSIREVTLGRLGIAVTNEQGDWVLDLTDVSLPDGVFWFSATAEDLAGNTSAESPRLRIEIDTGIPNRPTIVQIDRDSGFSSSDGTTNDNTLTFSGMADPRSRVTVFENGLGNVGTAVADGLGAWTLDASSLTLQDGLYVFVAQASDVAGNNSPNSVLFQVEIDTVSPVEAIIERMESDTGQVANDGITNDRTLKFYGSAEAGTWVALHETVLGQMGRAIADSTGQWMIDASSIPLTDGAYEFTAVSTDTAGNVGFASEVFAVLIDTQSPDAPTIVRIEEDTGADANDGVTNDRTIALFGMAEPGALVTVTEGNLGELGNVLVEESGGWTFQLHSELADGDFEFGTFATDVAGNRSSDSISKIVRIDTIAPVPAEVSSIHDDTGSTADDGVTQDNTLIIRGTAEPGAEVHLLESGLGLLGIAVADSLGDWEVDATQISLADGSYQFAGDSYDVAGNFQPATSTFSVIVDTSAPLAPKIARINDDTGASLFDRVTQDNRLTFVGSAMPGATISLFESTLGLFGVSTTAIDGTWTIDAESKILADGGYEFYAIAEDNAGNSSSSSMPFPVFVDSVFPERPKLIGITSDSGLLADDAITNDNTLLFHGTAEPGSTVSVSEFMLGKIGSTIADIDGQWELDATAFRLSDHQFEFTATSEDIAGNTSNASDVFDVVVDTISPVAPLIQRIDADTGENASDQITSDNTLSFRGLAEAGSQVSVFETNLGLIGMALSDSVGAWLVDATDQELADRPYSFYAIALDVAGNSSQPSHAIDVLVDTVAPLQPTIDGIDQDTGTGGADGVTNDNTLLVFGTAEANSLVSVSDDRLGSQGAVSADEFGNWNIEIDLPDGVYRLIASSFDLAGNSSQSAGHDVWIDTLAPGVPTVVAIDDDRGSNSTDGVTNDSTLTLTGMSEPGVQVRVIDNLLGEIGSGLADSEGTWSIGLAALQDDHYELSVQAEDLAGNRSTPSEPSSVVIDTAAPETTEFGLAVESDSPPLGDHLTTLPVVTLEGITEPAAIVKLLLNLGPVGQKIGETTANVDGGFSFSNVELAAGENYFYVIATDLAGNASQFARTISQISSDTDPPLIDVELLDDTGDPTDQITSDPTLIGLVEDTSLLAFVDFYLYSEVLDTEFYVEITDELFNDEFVLDVSFFESLIGASMPYGRYFYCVEAEDIYGNFGFFDGEFVFVASDSGDLTPPEVTVELQNDTGPDGSDRITSDGTLVGSVIDESPVSVTVTIASADDLESGNEFQGDVTDLIETDGSFVIPQTRLESILGRTLDASEFYVSIKANDQFNVGGDSIDFEYILLADAPMILSVASDTGLSREDGVTSDFTLTITGLADPFVEIELWETELGTLGTVATDQDGHWSLPIHQHLQDGEYEFVAFALASGERSDPSNRFNVTIDTEAPLAATFDLDPKDDTGVVGDSYTTTKNVSLVGTASPHSEIRLVGSELSTISTADGSFRLDGIQLELGRRIYEIETRDLAGNLTISRKSIAYDQPVQLSESGLVSEVTRTIELGQRAGVRTVSMKLDADLEISEGLADTFSLYLVDSNDPAKTLLDRGHPGTAFFSMIGSRPDFLPGLVQFDGSTIRIDVSSLANYNEAVLVFQLVNNSASDNSQVTVSELSSLVDTEGVPAVAAIGHLAIEPGISFDTSPLNHSLALELVAENVRYDSSSNRYTADIRLKNNGSDLGRSIIASFGQLADDIVPVNPSGFNERGIPYYSFRESLPGYGLLSGHYSDAIRIEFISPTISPFLVAPMVLAGGANAPLSLEPIGEINIHPGEVTRVNLVGHAPDGQGIYYRIKSDGDLPNMVLTAEGQLVITPAPDQVGHYDFEVVVTDGVLTSSQPVTINVLADPIGTTRISGWILDTHSAPLPGIDVSLGGVTVVTESNGSFLLEFPAGLTDDTLLIYGQTYSGPEVYPFIAEKLPLLYGHDAYAGVNNVIERPIYLPALDVANGVPIDPAKDVTVTTSSIPNASVFVAAGTLETDDGSPFNGELSITEVPADFTPAALPTDQFPDMVVTIQPGEMVFTAPAPLNLPNLAGYSPGTSMTLWSINPNTGLFDNVGTGVVSSDGMAVETLSGGINSSSWHFFGVAGPLVKSPESNNRNLKHDCGGECENRHAFDDTPRPKNDRNAGNENNRPLNTESVDRVANAVSGSNAVNPSNSAGTVTTHGRRGNRGFAGGWGSGGQIMMSSSANFGPYGSWGGSSGATVTLDSLGAGSNTAPSNQPLLAGNNRNAKNTEVALHSGALLKRHDLVAYQSLGAWRGLTLNYDSQRADARPIISTGFDEIQNNLPDPILATKLTINRGNLSMQIPGFFGTVSGLTGGEHFFQFPATANSLDIALQADMRDMPTGVYEYESSNRFAGNQAGPFTGTATIVKERLVHVNTSASPFGSGWGLSGLLELIENPDGTILVVDGNGSEWVFDPPEQTGEVYQSPAGDFSRLIKLPDGRFQRTHTDQTIETFSSSNKLASIQDRHGNTTSFIYNAVDQLESVIDPVGLTTTFRYSGQRVVEIEDPAGRVTFLEYANGNLTRITDPDNSARQFSYDSLNRLVGEVDKLGRNEQIQYGFSGRIESAIRKDGSKIDYSPVQTAGLARPDLTNVTTSQVAANDFGSLATTQRADANGNLVQLELDKLGQLISSRDAEGDQGAIARTEFNLVDRVVDGRGNVTIYGYDEYGNTVSTSDVISRGGISQPNFADPTYPVPPGTDQIIAADMNGDGFIDIVSESGSSGDNISVQLGNGSGGFDVGTTYEIVDPVSLTAADVDHDGQLDIVVAQASNQITVMLGNGDGTLRTHLQIDVGMNPQRVVAMDFDHDGFTDLATTNRDDNTVSTLFGDGSGGFGGLQTYTVGQSPASLVATDINQDFAIDLVVGHVGGDQGVSVLLNDGNGSFQGSLFVETGIKSKNVIAGEFTGDGIQDIIVGDADLQVLRGRGDGTFFAPETIETGSSPSEFEFFRVESLDVDLDGDSDLIFADTREEQIHVITNDGNGNFTLAASTSANGRSLTKADVNSDGFVDLVVIKDGLVSIMGTGDGIFVSPAALSNKQISAGDGASSLAIADFNLDGHQDIVVGGRNDSSLTVMLGDGDGSLTPLSPIISNGSVFSVVAVDLDADGNSDFVSAHYDLDRIEVRFGDGTGEFSEPIEIDFPGQGPAEVRTGDFDNDGHLDIVTVGHRGSSDSGFSVTFGHGDRTFTAGPLVSSTFQAGTIDVGDVNNDGILDVVVGVAFFSNGNAARPYFGNGDGTFTDQGRIPFGGGSFDGPPKQLRLVDLDLDGNLDIVGLDETGSLLKVLTGNGNGTFAEPVSYSVDASPERLDVGDIDGDGLLDVIVSNSATHRVSIFYGRTDGQLSMRSDFLVGDGPADVRIVDLDKDGAFDFVTANMIDDSVSIRINKTDALNQSAVVYEYESAFSQVTRSVDEEGRITIYEIDPSNGNTHSMTQVIGEFGGTDDIVTAYTYYSNGLIRTVTDPLGRVTEMEYTPAGLLQKIIYAAGTEDQSLVAYEYDDSGNQIAVIDELGRRTEFQYDNLNRLLVVTEPDPDDSGPLLAPVTSNAYDAHGNVVLATDALNNQTRFVYDQQHRLIELVDAQSNSIVHQYDHAGNMIATVDRLGRRTEFVYDQRNRLVETINAEIGRETFSYDADNNRTAFIDANGVLTRYVFDARNRPVRTINALGGTVFNHFDRVNNLVGTTDEIGRHTELSYDELDRLIVTTLPDPDGNGPADSPTSSFVYDDAGNTLRITDALGNTIEQEYDDRNRLVQVTESDPDGSGPLERPNWITEFDHAGRVTRSTDPLGRITDFEYDNLDRLVVETRPDPDGAGPSLRPQLFYSYDAVHNRRSVTDALGNTVSFSYDNLHRLVSITQPDPDDAGPLQSPVRTFEMDAEGQVTRTIDPLGRATIFEYDQLGRLILEVLPDPDGAGPNGSPILKYFYDGVGNRVRSIDALGNESNYVFDGLYRLVRMIESDPDGAGPQRQPVTTMKYDAAHQLLETSDPLGRTTTYKYDSLGRKVQLTLPDPDGIGGDAAPISSYEYDLMNNLVSSTDALGNTTRYSYDALYRLTEMIKADPDGDGPETNPVYGYEYDAASQKVSEVDSLGRLTSMQYDDLGRLVIQTAPDPDGAGPLAAPVVNYRYDLADNLLLSIDALGNETRFEYDNLYRTTKVILEDPDGPGPQSNPTTEFVYDIVSQLTSTIDPLGRVTYRHYDDLGRMVRQVLPDPDGAGPMLAPELTFEFDSMNNMRTSTDAVGNVTQFEYDNLYRMTRLVESDPDGTGPLASPETVYEFDIADQLLAITDPLGRTTTNKYDALGRIIETIQPDPDGPGAESSPVTTNVYDLTGNLRTSTDANGNSTQYEYDSLYRLVREIGEDLDDNGPFGNPISIYNYDLESNLIEVIDSNQNRTEYRYDGLDRLVEETIELDTGRVSRHFEYDAEDNLVRRTDRNNRVTEFEYDSLYRLIEESWLDNNGDIFNTIQFEFDKASQMLRAEDVTTGSRHQLFRDGLGRVVQSSINNGGPEVVFDEAFDTQNRRLSQTTTVGGVSDFRNDFTYDGLNRMIQISQTAQSGGNQVADKLAQFEFNSDHQLTEVKRFNDLSAASGQDAFKSLYQYDGIGRLTGLEHSNGSSTIAVYDWEFDPGSRITKLVNSIDGTSQVGYDNTNQLVSATHDSQAEEAYQYDEGGNRTGGSYATGLYHRLVADSQFEYVYDNEGNRIEQIDLSSGEVREFHWDHRNRLIAVTTRTNAGAESIHQVTHRYDVFNRWISKSVDADGAGGEPAKTTNYFYDGQQIVLTLDEEGTVLHRYVWGPGDHLVANEQVGNQVYWAATDHLGTIRDVVNSNGVVANHIVYDSFGNIDSESAPAVDVLFGFTGRPFDESTGLQNNLNRWYDAGVGRWISEDPISFEGGDTNLYRYVGNRVLTSTDPTGLMDFWQSKLGRGLSRIYHLPIKSAEVLAKDIVYSTLDRAHNDPRTGYGIRLGEAGTNVFRTLASASSEYPTYFIEEVGPALGELAAFQTANLSGNEDLALKIHQNSRFNQSRDLQNYINLHGAEHTREVLESAMVFADIAAHVYTGKKDDTLHGFVLRRRFRDRVWGNSGFQAAIYESPNSGAVILAYEGTNPKLASLDGRRDICQDIKQGMGQPTEQYELAIKLAERAKAKYGDDLILTGHSLGGGLATAAALVHDIPAFVVDPAGVHPQTIERHGGDFSRANELVHGIRLYGEFLTTFVNTAPGASPTVGNILTIPAPKFHEPFGAHSSSLVANYIRDLLKIPRPPKD